MAAIEIFKNESFGEIRVAGTSDDPLFCLSDLCRALDLQNPTTVKNRLDADDVQLIDLHALNLTEGSIGNTKANFVTESGFYDVILQSTSPKVKPFKRWVTKDVLPSIRRSGNYSIENNMSDPFKQMQQMKLGVEWVKDVSSLLNLNDVSKLKMLSEIARPLNLPLPPYVNSKGVVKSASELLFKMNINISAQVFNRRAIEKGYLCEMERNSSYGQKKKFKSITKIGLEFGENQVNPNNPKSTQPLWYEDKFSKLLRILGFVE